jgi:hypothetical protein
VVSLPEDGSRAGFETSYFIKKIKTTGKVKKKDVSKNDQHSIIPNRNIFSIP